MAFFGFKKAASGDKANPPVDGAGNGAGNGTGGGGTVGTGEGGYEFSPEKAQRWFHHARTSHEAGNYEYAMTCWLNGLRFEPTNLEAIKQFFTSAGAFNAPVTKDLAKAASGKTDVDKFLAALLNFGCKPTDPEMAVRAATSAGDLGLADVVDFLAPLAISRALSNPKPRKDQFIRLMMTCREVGRFDLAVKAGEGALRLDPSDNKLSADVRNLAAQSTMTKGGYDQTGEAGGFRSNVRDAAKQRQLEDLERVVKSESVLDRTIATVQAEYEARPQDRPTIMRYVDALWERRKNEDVRTAMQVLKKAYQDTQEFRFRERFGDMQMKIGRGRLHKLREAAAANPSDAAAQEALVAGQKEMLDLEIKEFEASVSAYPTDLARKFELGKRYYDAGRFDDSIDLLQQAKEDTKNRATVLSHLGQAFAAKGWHEEAVGTYRLALEGHGDPNDAAAMELRYGLMVSLQQYAEEHKDVSAAEEAGKLASQIALQQMSFKDVRARRDAIKALLARLRGG